MSKVRLFGRIVSGEGEGREYLELDWVKKQIMEKLGFTPFPGTLNLQLDEESSKIRKKLDETTAMGICHSRGYCVGLLFRASIAGLPCGVVVPRVENYRVDLLEVFAPVNLRQDLRLHDGDSVEVDVLL